jgi:hypothetical protein
MKAKHKRYLILAAFAVLMTALVMIAGCAPKQNTTDQPSGPSVQLPDWTVDSDCTKCHAVQVASMANSATAASAHHWYKCTGCHPDTNGTLTAAHENYSGTADPTQLSMTSVSDDICTHCHDDAAELAANTADSQAFTALVGHAVNPHALPECPAHEGAMNCVTCHKLHAPMDTTADTAADVCGGCHHDGYYEPCSDCHTEGH